VLVCEPSRVPGAMALSAWASRVKENDCGGGGITKRRTYVWVQVDAGFDLGQCTTGFLMN
jgi:hypothetical protein